MQRKIIYVDPAAPNQGSIRDELGTSNAEAMSPLPELGPIEQVREGMRVIDAAGEELGTVEVVKMGDPQAATVGADAPGDGGLFEDVANVFGFGGEPPLPAALQARLMRLGFIKVDGQGLTDRDRYVRADKIAGVSSETVRLSVRRDDMAEEI